jgi:hypothetical protein
LRRDIADLRTPHPAPPRAQDSGARPDHIGRRKESRSVTGAADWGLTAQRFSNSDTKSWATPTIKSGEHDE